MSRWRKKAKYPVATIMFYGRDDVRATKVVVGIIRNEKDEDGPLERWVSGRADVRDDERIGEHIRRFLERHCVKQVIMADRITGCPHEEGEDYPIGEACPFCPFWKNRDRFTHEVEP